MCRDCQLLNLIYQIFSLADRHKIVRLPCRWGQNEIVYHPILRIIRISWERINRADMAKRDTNLQKLSETIHITVEELRGLGIKRLVEYLYKNEELDCYIQDVIAADGKETNNTGKKKSEKWLEDRTDWKKLMSIGYERESISKKRRMKRFGFVKLNV